MIDSRRIGQRFSVLVVAIVLMTGLVACGGGSSSNSTSSSSGTSVSVSEKEFTITVNGTELHNGQGDASVPSGNVTFDIKNAGTVGHAFEIQGNGIDQKTSTIDPGGSAKLTVNLTPGTYEVWCPVPGHKEAGMDGHVTVK